MLLEKGASMYSCCITLLSIFQWLLTIYLIISSLTLEKHPPFFKKRHMPNLTPLWQSAQIRLGTKIKNRRGEMLVLLWQQDFCDVKEKVFGCSVSKCVLTS